MSRKYDEMTRLQHALLTLFGESTTKLRHRNLTLIWQNSKMKRMKLDEAELDFMLYLKRNYKMIPSEQFLKDNMVDVQKTERILARKVMQPEDLALIDSEISKRKNMIISEQRRLNDLEEIEKAFKKQIKIMENSLELKTLEFGQIRSELAKIRNEFYSLGHRLGIFEGMFFKLKDQHDCLFSKMQVICKSCVDFADRITDADSKVVALKQLIKLNEYYFSFELNEMDRQYMQNWNFENFLVDISRERDWYSLDNCLKKLEKELSTRHRQMNENQAALATIRNIGNYNDINITLSDFRYNKINNFALFRFAVEIHCQLMDEDNELQSLLAKFDEEEKSYLGQYSMLRNSLLSYQKKVNVQREYSKVAQEEIAQADEQITMFHKELIELMEILACDSKLKTEVENANFKEEFLRDAVIDIQEKIIRILHIKKYLTCQKREATHQNLIPYENAHCVVLNPSEIGWD